MSDLAKALLIVIAMLILSTLAGYYFGTEPLCNSITC
jgi:hypothetical protein